MISAFGLAVELALAVPELDDVAPVPQAALPSGPVLRVELAEDLALDGAWSGAAAPPVIGRAVVDGSGWTAERGRDDDILMQHALARFHLDRSATRLLCAPRKPDAPAWRRLLLDTALVTVSLARGRDALHAACVVQNGAAIAIAGSTGAGKTTMLVELLRAGAAFLADDVVVLEQRGEEVLALPGPPLANLPASEPDGPLAERLHALGDEWWVRIREPDVVPRPLRAVLVLEPGEPGSRAPLTVRLEETQLLGHALHSGSTPERLQQRFALLAHVASGAELIGIRVDRSQPPRELVGRMIEAVPALQA